MRVALPDLEHAKAAVLNSLNSADAERGYGHAIDEFVDPAGVFNTPLAIAIRHIGHVHEVHGAVVRISTYW